MILLYLLGRVGDDWQPTEPPLKFHDDPSNTAVDKAQERGERWTRVSPEDRRYDIERVI